MISCSIKYLLMSVVIRSYCRRENRRRVLLPYYILAQKLLKTKKLYIECAFILLHDLDAESNLSMENKM